MYKMDTIVRNIDAINSNLTEIMDDIKLNTAVAKISKDEERARNREYIRRKYQDNPETRQILKERAKAFYHKKRALLIESGALEARSVGRPRIA